MGFYHIRNIDTSGNIPYICLIISTRGTPFLAKLLVLMMMLWFVTPLPTSLACDGLTMATSILAVIWLTAEITPMTLFVSIILADRKVSIFPMGFAAVVRGHLPVSRVNVCMVGSINLLPTLSPSLFLVPVFLCGYQVLITVLGSWQHITLWWLVASVGLMIAGWLAVACCSLVCLRRLCGMLPPAYVTLVSFFNCER